MKRLVLVTFYSLMCFCCLGQAVWAQDQMADPTKPVPQHAAAQASERTAPLQVRQVLQAQRNEIKAKGYQLFVGVTPMTDKNLDSITGCNPPPATSTPPPSAANSAKPQALSVKAGGANASSRVFSWVGYFPPPRNQSYADGSTRWVKAGTCWAFSVQGAFDASYALFHGGTKMLFSEQQLVSCSGAGDLGGGYPWDAENWICSNGGTCRLAVYPYVAAKPACMKVTEKYPARGWWWLPTEKRVWSTITLLGMPVKLTYNTSSVATIKSYLVNYGPILTCVYADNYWQNYEGGILCATTVNVLGNTAPKQPATNHAIVIVGWNDDYGAWYVRNSWGTGWGYGGYCWVKYDSNFIGMGSTLIQAK